jgi:hypothetical protein
MDVARQFRGAVVSRRKGEEGPTNKAQGKESAQGSRPGKADSCRPMVAQEG